MQQYALYNVPFDEDPMTSVLFPTEAPHNYLMTVCEACRFMFSAFWVQTEE